MALTVHLVVTAFAAAVAAMYEHVWARLQDGTFVENAQRLWSGWRDLLFGGD